MGDVYSDGERETEGWNTGPDDSRGRALTRRETLVLYLPLTSTACSSPPESCDAD